VAARIEAQCGRVIFPGAQTMGELVADRATRRLIGGAVIGEEGAGGRIDVIAAALQAACGWTISSIGFGLIRRPSRRCGTRC